MEYDVIDVVLFSFVLFLLFHLDGSHLKGLCDNAHNVFPIEPNEFPSEKVQSLLPQNHTQHGLHEALE